MTNERIAFIDSIIGNGKDVVFRKNPQTGRYELSAYGVDITKLLDTTIFGYFYNGKFYADEQHTHPLHAFTGKFYFDLTEKVMHYYNGTKYSETTIEGSWENITGKPFESIGAGLHVDEDGVLSATAGGGFPYTQYEASSLWVIEHNLGKHPSVSVVDSAGSQVYGDVTYVNDNVLTITFTLPFAGKAYLN